MTWWVDRHSRIVVRGHAAVHLSIIEFAVLMSFYHGKKTRRIAIRPGREIVNNVYQGVKSPPLYPNTVVMLAAKRMTKKLERIGLRIRACNRRHNSFYQIEDLRC